MNLLQHQVLGGPFVTGPHKVRILTESWFGAFGFCLRCFSEELERTPANTPACDFRCPVCDCPYELKSGAGKLATKVVDGAYRTMMERVRLGEAPNLILLRYNKDWLLQSITALHSVFLTPTVVEQRPPLAPSARRAGWVGCNLRIDRIPPDGHIPLVTNGIATDRSVARRLYAQSNRLGELKPEQRGWTALVLGVIRKIGRTCFNLNEIYAHETVMLQAYPNNAHVRDKIRQQLQVLRDLGYLEFLGKGEYKTLL